MHCTKSSKFTLKRISEGTRIFLWQADGGAVLSTSDGRLFICLTPEDMYEKVKQLLGVDENGNLHIQEVKTKQKRTDKDISCPYCTSYNTNGHGSRKTRKEIQLRRMCSNCARTFVIEKRPYHVPVGVEAGSILETTSSHTESNGH